MKGNLLPATRAVRLPNPLERSRRGVKEDDDRIHERSIRDSCFTGNTSAFAHDLSKDKIDKVMGEARSGKLFESTEAWSLQHPETWTENRLGLRSSRLTWWETGRKRARRTDVEEIQRESLPPEVDSA